jgi:DNA topoisomerase-1
LKTGTDRRGVGKEVDRSRKESGKNEVKPKWRMLRHKGILFPEEYQSQGLTLRIRGAKTLLTPVQEEMAWAWAKKIGTPYVEDKVFAKNFITCFRKILPYEYRNVSISDIDFSDIVEYQAKDKEWRSQPDVKKKLAAERKERRLALKEKYGYAEIDGHRVEVANYLVEPPGIFMGRGKHPMRGLWKPRIYQEDVTLNLDKNAPIPSGKWGKIVHDSNSMWLACWLDKLTKKVKYVWLHDSSTIRQQRDQMKYDKAMKLQTKLSKVRKHISKGLVAKDEKTRKIASVCYLIDNLCMRVGDEKDEDEADTVGASTLRVEHVKITSGGVQFDFLGKDSIPWSKSISTNDEGSRLFRSNLEKFMKGKKRSEPIFDGIRSTHVNRFLGNAAPGLTAKVFRTFHATNVTRDYLEQQPIKKNATDYEKLYYAKRANLETAITCNHKRTPPKTWEQSLLKKEERKIPKTEAAKQKHKQRIRKAELSVKLYRETKDYNLNTSLRNYIDPRVYKHWSDEVDLDWRQIYPKTLQTKFSWVDGSNNGSQEPEAENSQDT